MLFVRHNNTNPYKNHAIEEFLMNKFNDDCFLLWKNDKCILIGRNQNTYSEINTNYVKEHNITIVRRITGGGAVFCDEGNFCYTFISCSRDKYFTDFKTFTAPIIAALNKLGVKAELSGRNDLTIDGKKISGNAQCKYKDKVLHHGTLLFSMKMSDLANSLNVRPVKLESKGIKSVESRVANISNYLETPMTADEFKEYLFNEVLESTENAVLYEITDEDWKEIDRIAEEKYASWEWNFGNNPKFNVEKEKRFPSGIVQAYLDINKGVIDGIKIFGDFFSEKDVSLIENALEGTKYEYDSIREVLKDFNMDEYFKGISQEEIMEVLI